eukprot:TRINITY_DN3406_c0_g1_i1.p1 TRINITY_DN3406_c0_g1~~TRINITY_DN3406_c0_g1_i1.p1  ORF type:complete len:417 (+),score=90.52 TRINITY_DN3406_c0_g1_i1:3-1253(+)
MMKGETSVVIPSKQGSSFGDAQHQMMDATVVQIHASLLKLLRCILIIPYPPKSRRKRNNIDTPFSFRVVQILFVAFWTYTAIERAYVFVVIRKLSLNMVMAFVMLDSLVIISFVFLSYLFRPQNLLRFKHLAKKVALSGASFESHLKKLKRNIKGVAIMSMMFGIGVATIYLRVIYIDKVELPFLINLFYHVRVMDAALAGLCFVPIIFKEYLWMHKVFVKGFLEEMKVKAAGLKDKGLKDSSRRGSRSTRESRSHSTVTESSLNGNQSSVVDSVLSISTHRLDETSSVVSLSKDDTMRNQLTKTARGMGNQTFADVMLDAKRQVSSLMHKAKSDLQLFVMLTTLLLVLSMLSILTGLFDFIQQGRVYDGAVGIACSVPFSVYLWIFWSAIESLKQTKREFNDAFVGIVGTEDNEA